MSKSNKELAVEIYCAFLQSAATTFQNSKESIKLPTVPEMIDTIHEIQNELSNLTED